MTPEILEKLARMHAMSVADKELAQIAGIDETQLREVFGTSEFVAVLAKINEEHFAQMDLVNRGWDGVEELAVGKVLETLQNPGVDPDYSLRAAVLANKAVRRGNSGLQHNRNNPLVVQPGLQSVIQLHVTYVQKLEQGFTIENQADKVLQQKEVNFLQPAEAKRLLHTETSGKTQIERDAEDTIISLRQLLSIA